MAVSRFLVLGAVVVVVLLVLPVAHATDQFAEDRLSLSQIVLAVEKRDLGSITDVEFEHGLWEIEIHHGTRQIELYLDAKTGEVKRREESTDRHESVPPAGSKALSEVIASVEARGLGIITEVEFDDGYWEFEIRDGAKKVKLDVDPSTGKDRTGR